VSIGAVRERRKAKGERRSGPTCILLDGREVDVLEVLVHLEQRTAATGSATALTAAQWPFEALADSAPWLRLAAAVRSTHSLCNRGSGGVSGLLKCAGELRRRPRRLQASAAFSIAAEPQSQRYAARYATGRASAARASAARYARAYRSCDSPVAMFEALTYLRASAALSAIAGPVPLPRAAQRAAADRSRLRTVVRLSDGTSATALSAVRCVESIGAPPGGMGHSSAAGYLRYSTRTRRMQRPSGLRARPQSRPTRRAQCT
jgi:hypothetical protein